MKAEADTDHRLHRQHPRFQGRRQVLAELRHGGPEQGQDQDQSSRGALVFPDAADLVDHGLQGMAVLEDIHHREIGGDEAGHQAAEGKEHQQELRPRRHGRNPHPGGIAAIGADLGHDGLHHRDQDREDQCILAEFGAISCLRLQV